MFDYLDDFDSLDAIIDRAIQYEEWLMSPEADAFFD